MSAQPRPPLISLGEHPRAQEGIRRAKAAGALLGFLAVGISMYRRGATLDQAGLRALAGGIGGWMIAWIAAVVVWRQLLIAETRAAVRRAIELRQREAER